MGQTLVFRTRNMGTLRRYFTQQRLPEDRRMTNAQFRRHTPGSLRRRFTEELSVSLTITSLPSLRRVIETLREHPLVNESHEPVIQRFEQLERDIIAAGGWWPYWESQVPPHIVAMMRATETLGQMAKASGAMVDAVKAGAKNVEKFSAAARGIMSALGIEPDGEPKRLTLV